MILNVLMFFIRKDIISTNEAKYPTHSVIVIPKIILVIVCLKKKPHSKMSEENCYEKDW